MMIKAPFNLGLQASGCSNRNYYVGGKVVAKVVAASRESLLLALAVKEQEDWNTRRGANPLLKRIQWTKSTCAHHVTDVVDDVYWGGGSPWKKGMATENNDLSLNKTEMPQGKPIERCNKTLRVSNPHKLQSRALRTRLRTQKEVRVSPKRVFILWKTLKPKQAFAEIWSHQLHVPQGRREVQVHPSNKWNQPPQALIFSASNSSICVDVSPQHTKPRSRDSLTTFVSKSSLLRLTPTSS
jgi:hypothetical protein